MCGTDYPQLLTLMESFKHRSESSIHSDQHELLVDFLRYGLEQKEKELVSVKAQHAVIAADLQTVQVCNYFILEACYVWLLLLLGEKSATSQGV